MSENTIQLTVSTKVLNKVASIQEFTDFSIFVGESLITRALYNWI